MISQLVNHLIIAVSARYFPSMSTNRTKKLVKGLDEEQMIHIVNH